MLVTELRAAGASPFVVPAMGSHGGGSAEGQLEVLAELGVTERSVGAPIFSSMEVDTIGHTASGIPVSFDRHAAAADLVFVVNRVSPHTEFSGTIGSGLMKMLTFGLGKRAGVERYHRDAYRKGYENVIRELAGVVLGRARIVGGIAILENAYSEVADVQVVASGDIVQREPELYGEAMALVARLPFSKIDLMIVDEIGKNISGAGMDPTVTGRGATARRLDTTEVSRIYVRSLSPKSRGNASGLGLADFVSQRVVDDMDAGTTYTNCLAAQVPEYARIPITVSNDKAAFDAALRTLGSVEPKDLRAVWIRDTKHLSEILVSEALAAEAATNPAVQVSGRPTSLEFDQAGDLPPFDSCLIRALAYMQEG